MTKKELSRYYYLEKEIIKDRADLAILQSRVTHITQNFSDMPKEQQKSNKEDEIIAEMVERDELLHKKLVRAEKERNNILRYINTIDDALIRLIIQYRYLNLLTWTKVAYFVGGGNTADSVRMLSDRYIRTHN